MIDLRPHFRHLEWRPMGHSFGIPVGSDWSDKPADDPVFGLYKNCGVWTMDEANILYECARRVTPGAGLDIGCHTGWTTAHMAAGGLDVVAVDPMLRLEEFQSRFEQNMETWWERVCYTSFSTSNDYFEGLERLTSSRRIEFELICIDGDHDPPCPVNDAKNAAAHLTRNGVILLHDFVGRPVREAVTWLMDNGFNARVYQSVHCVAVCWRGRFSPPDFTPDPLVLAQDLPARWPDFDLSRCW